MLALTALAAALRFATLGVQSYWADEAVTARLLDGSLGHLLDRIPSSESTPPLYYVLAWLWTRVFGLGEAGLRSLSAVFGTALVPIAYVLGARLASARAGLATAALVAVNPLLWWYSQEARSYALLVLLTAAATAAFLRTRDREGGVAAWSVLSALALATHYFAVFVVAPQALWIVWRRRAWLPVAGVVAVTGALLPLAIRQADNHGAKFIEASGSLAFRIGQVPKQFLVGFDAPLEVPATVAAALLALVAVALLAMRADGGERRGAVLAAITALVVLALPVAGALAGADYVLARNLLPALVPALAVFGVGFASSRAGAFALAGLCAISVATVMAVSANERYQRDNWRDAARALGPATRDRVIGLTPADGVAPMEWYLRGTRPIGSANIAVGELDILAIARRTPGRELEIPRGPFPVPQGFGLAKQTDGKTYRALRFTADPPVGVTYFSAAANRLSNVPVTVLVQQKAAQKP